MRFPHYGNYTLDISGNVLEVFATGAWNLKTAHMFVEEMHELTLRFKDKPWAALMDGRRWVLSTSECQQCLTEAIKVNISNGLRCSAYVLDSGMVKRAQLEHTHPAKDHSFALRGYERAYFSHYFEGLNYLHQHGFSPIKEIGDKG